MMRTSVLGLVALVAWSCTRSAEPKTPEAPAPAQKVATDAEVTDAARLRDAAAPPARDAQVAEAKSCRRPLPTLPPAEPSELVLPAALVADAVGNADGALTGIEVDVARAASSLSVGARCWLGVDWHPAKGLSSAPLELVLRDVCGLDCGDDHKGLGADDGPIFVRACPAAIAVTVEASGLRLAKTLLVDGRGLAFNLVGPVPATPAAPRPISAVGAEVAESEPDCGEDVRAAASVWSKALGEGQCPIDRLERWDGLGDYHRDPPRCGWPLAMVDLAGVRRCAAGDGALARQLFAVFGSWEFPTMAGRVQLPMDELVGDQALPGRPADPTRTIEWGRWLQDEKALDARGRAVLLNAMTGVPLGVLDDQVGLPLGEQVDARSLEDGLLVWLAQRDRLQDLPEKYRQLSAVAAKTLADRLSARCAHGIAAKVGRAE